MQLSKLRLYLVGTLAKEEDHPEMNTQLNALFTSWTNLWAVFPWKPGKFNFEAFFFEAWRQALGSVSLRATVPICMIYKIKNDHWKRGMWKANVQMYVKVWITK